MQGLENIQSCFKFGACGPISYRTVNTLKRIQSSALVQIFKKGGSLSVSRFSKGSTSAGSTTTVTPQWPTCTFFLPPALFLRVSPKQKTRISPPAKGTGLRAVFWEQQACSGHPHAVRTPALCGRSWRAALGARPGLSSPQPRRRLLAYPHVPVLLVLRLKLSSGCTTLRSPGPAECRGLC